MNIYDMRRCLRNYLSQSPMIYQCLATGKQGRRVHKKTDIVVEGFPRSANSYLEAVFTMYCKPKPYLAHHTHAKATVVLAAKWNIPTIVLVRNPIDAVISHLEESHKLSSPGTLFEEYIIFYQNLHKLEDKALLTSFETATSNPSLVLSELNKKFGCSFEFFLRPELHQKSIMLTVEAIAQDRAGITPAYLLQENKEKHERKIRREKIATKVKSKNYEKKRSKAVDIYNKMIGFAI